MLAIKSNATLLSGIYPSLKHLFKSTFWALHWTGRLWDDTGKRFGEGWGLRCSQLHAHTSPSPHHRVQCLQLLLWVLLNSLCCRGCLVGIVLSVFMASLPHKIFLLVLGDAQESGRGKADAETIACLDTWVCRRPLLVTSRSYHGFTSSESWCVHDCLTKNPGCWAVLQTAVH